MSDGRDRLARRFRGQAEACGALGSPLYAALATRAAADIESRGPVWRASAALADLPGGALPALRFLGATHRLALDGSAPALAARYPSCGGDGDADGAWATLSATVDGLAGDASWDALLARGVQTNEVGRAAALLGGFLSVARTSGLPLRLLETGASAGLNLRWDCFRYGPCWGPSRSPVDQGDPFVDGRRPDLTPATVEIAERAGCDVAPLDPTSPDGRLTLLSFVWPDMRRRFELLDGACTVARGLPVTVDAVSADVWAEDRLAEPVPGTATVLYHSVFLQYMPSDARERLVTAIARAGRAASPEAPMAWLRLEPPGPLGPPEFEVRLTTWPGGEDRRLATCHPHGIWVDWCG